MYEEGRKPGAGADLAGGYPVPREDLDGHVLVLERGVPLIFTMG